MTKREETTTEFIARMKADVKFNKHDLDGAIETQTTNFADIAEAVALAISRRDEAKDNLKVVEAEIDADIRKSIELDKDTKKPSEPQIKMMIMLDKDMGTAQKRFDRLARDARALEACKESYSQRSYMLREMVALWLGGYYSDTVAKGRAGQEVKRTQYDRDKGEISAARHRRT